jgi:uncharacterized protein YndB with AHSA1/START domain
MTSHRADTPTTGSELKLEREFDAPLKTVFEAWTNSKHVAAWWGPEGFTTTMTAWEAHAGGNIHLEMNAPNGAVYPMSGRFTEVTPPGKIAFKGAALDPKGKAIFEILNTVTFEEAKGKTKLTLHTEVLWMGPDAAPYLEGQKAGWSQSLDRLGVFVTRNVP